MGTLITQPNQPSDDEETVSSVKKKSLLGGTLSKRILGQRVHNVSMDASSMRSADPLAQQRANENYVL